MGRDADPGRTTLKRDDRQHESARQLLVELVRFNLESFELEDQGVAALFGLEPCSAGGRYVSTRTHGHAEGTLNGKLLSHPQRPEAEC